jgi:hypothetical protein
MIDIQKEWDFVIHETHYNKPKIKPYTGNDLLKRELLFILQSLLSTYNRDKSSFNLMVYELSKSQYIKLISEKNDNQGINTNIRK